ncbi:CTP synthase [bacterium]|nr:CTP synthase [bacterium]
MKRSKTKIIFVTGGVISSLGKGITAASLGVILKAHGFSVNNMKFDPYINVDSGTMNPFQHGEVYVTKDGAETDLDLGHYERFTGRDMTESNNVTTGKVYSNVIEKERKGEYLGDCVQVVPHITNDIKERIYKLVHGKDDFLICEIGGTVGDIESLPFLEAIRQVRLEYPMDVLNIHLTLVPYIKTAGELKTKPTQHSVNELRRIGIQPDFLGCRSEKKLNKHLRAKISLFCNVIEENVISLVDMKSIYEVPINIEKQGMAQKIMEYFNLYETKKSDYLERWGAFYNKLIHPKGKIKLAIVGKYVDLTDSYMSIKEAIVHASSYLELETEVKWIESEELEESTDILKGYDGVLIPGGFGERGIEGMVKAAQFARENNLPYFGICLGMQIMAIEIARNILNLENANSTEFDKSTKYNVIDIQETQKGVKAKGGTQRLGHYPCKLKKNSVAHGAYEETIILERHRHRFEFNNKYKELYEKNDVIFSGICPENDLVEVMELPNRPFYLGCQFHPELQSRPLEAHPLFIQFLKIIKEVMDESQK